MIFWCVQYRFWRILGDGYTAGGQCWSVRRDWIPPSTQTGPDGSSFGSQVWNMLINKLWFLLGTVIQIWVSLTFIHVTDGLHITRDQRHLKQLISLWNRCKYEEHQPYQLRYCVKAGSLESVTVKKHMCSADVSNVQKMELRKTSSVCIMQDQLRKTSSCVVALNNLFGGCCDLLAFVILHRSR